MREVKFKVWNGKEMKGHFDLSQNPIYWEGLEDGERLLYTGLKDKNGVEIYEADMVSTDLKRPYNVVVFKNGCFMYECEDVNGIYYDAMIPIHTENYEEKYFEVIGNIYENKELLGE